MLFVCSEEKLCTIHPFSGSYPVGRAGAYQHLGAKAGETLEKVARRSLAPVAS